MKRHRHWGVGVCLGTWMMLPGLIYAEGLTPTAVAFDEQEMTVTDTQTLSQPADTDLDKPMLETLRRPDRRFLQVSPDNLLAINEKASMKLNSSIPAEPWLATLVTPPYLVVYPSLSKGVKIKEWRFSIMDDAGKTLWTQQAQGSIPAKLSWDGRVTTGGMIEVGIPFFYTLGAMDQGGNPIFMSGPSQQLTGMVFMDGNRLIIRISASQLFTSTKDVTLSNVGEGLLRDSLVQIAKGHYNSFQITAFANTEKFGDMQAEQIIRFYVRQFSLPRDKFTSVHQVINDRFKVEILCKP